MTASPPPKLLLMRGGPQLVVFVASACLMVLEIVAGRLISGFLGASLYTWTSVIGVILAGIAVGNQTGGVLADRFGPERLIGPLLLLGSATCLAILALAGWVTSAELFAGLTWPVRIGLSVAFIFFIPSCVLGTVSPVIMTATLRHRDSPGRTVGLLHASGAAGSVAGTFLAGFVLLGLFGTTAIIWGVAAVLAFLALLFLKRPGAQLAGAALLGVGVAAAGATAQGDGWVLGAEGQRLQYELDSDYFHIVVTPAGRFDPNNELARAYPTANILLLDAMVHGMEIPGRPDRLIYTYERLTALLTEAVGTDALSTLFIGGGAYTFPRYLEAAYPAETAIDVVEIDPAVTEAVHQAMNLPRATRIHTINQDARVFVKQTDRRYDIIYGDAFNGFSIPTHLTTVEFVRELSARLTPRGAYILNIVDSPRSMLLVGAICETLRGAFRRLAIYTVTGEHERQTFVIYASNFERELPELVERGARRFAERELDALPRLLLTDELAPVDQLIAPIYARRTLH